MEFFEDFESLIGNTPLVKLDLLSPATCFGKLEYLNPGGSIKDRSALFMINAAEKNGLLKPGGTIVEASSGNQGIALAMIGKLRGYKVIITVPDRTSKEKVATIRAYGADVLVCEDCVDELGAGYHSVAVGLAKSVPGAFMPNQYFNAANIEAHYSTTGPEIWRQTDGKVTHVFVGAGSCGTIMGVGRYVKERNPAVKIIGVDAETSVYSSADPKPYENEGIGIDSKSGLLDTKWVDDIQCVGDRAAFDRTRWLVRNSGILVGPSSGSVVEVALRFKNSFKPDDVVVLMMADSGRAYLEKLFGDRARGELACDSKNTSHLEMTSF